LDSWETQVVLGALKEFELVDLGMSHAFLIDAPLPFHSSGTFVTSNGWKFNIFFDGNAPEDWDYINWVQAPDGWAEHLLSAPVDLWSDDVEDGDPKMVLRNKWHGGSDKWICIDIEKPAVRDALLAAMRLPARQHCETYGEQEIG
jgi:hypothetical protein